MIILTIMNKNQEIKIKSLQKILNIYKKNNYVIFLNLHKSMINLVKNKEKLIKYQLIIINIIIV